MTVTFDEAGFRGRQWTSSVTGQQYATKREALAAEGTTQATIPAIKCRGGASSRGCHSNATSATVDLNNGDISYSAVCKVHAAGFRRSYRYSSATGKWPRKWLLDLGLTENIVSLADHPEALEALLAGVAAAKVDAEKRKQEQADAQAVRSAAAKVRMAEEVTVEWVAVRSDEKGYDFDLPLSTEPRYKYTPRWLIATETDLAAARAIIADPESGVAEDKLDSLLHRVEGRVEVGSQYDQPCIEVRNSSRLTVHAAKALVEALTAAIAEIEKN